MKIPDEALDEFIKIYKETFCEELSRSDAEEMASRVVTLYEVLAQKLPNERVPAPKPPDDSPQV